jgi:hypothetical protein
MTAVCLEGTLMENMPAPAWRKSSRCATSNCVEVAEAAPDILLRDSKNPDGTILAFSPPDWTGFLDAVAAGDYPA